MDVLKSTGGKKKKFTLIFFVCGFLASLLYLGNPESTPIIDIDSTKVGVVLQQEFNVEVSASAFLLTKNSGAVIAKEGGVITRRLVSNGDAVKKGDLLFEIDSPELTTKYYESQEEYYAEKSKSEFERLEMLKDYERTKGELIKSRLELKNKEIEMRAKEALFNLKNPTVSKMDYERVVMEYKIALSSYESNVKIMTAFEKSKSAKLQELEHREKLHADRVARLNDSVAALSVIAAHDGVVQDVSLDEGDLIQGLGLLCRIPSGREMYVAAQVPAFDIEKVKIGQTSLVFINQKSFEAVVTRIDPLVKESLVNVDLSLNDLTEEYRVNTPVRVIIQTEFKPSSLVVDRPVSARERAKSYVYVINGDTAERTEVSFGVGTVSKIEVLSGLSVGQKIITSDISSAVRSSPQVRIR